jgi:hypothetical protein
MVGMLGQQQPSSSLASASAMSTNLTDGLKFSPHTQFIARMLILISCFPAEPLLVGDHVGETHSNWLNYESRVLGELMVESVFPPRLKNELGQQVKRIAARQALGARQLEMIRGGSVRELLGHPPVRFWQPF